MTTPVCTCPHLHPEGWTPMRYAADDACPVHAKSPLTHDLCDHWVNHRCQNYWRVEVVLHSPVTVQGKVMCGTYPAGTWRFCKMHARIFNRDVVPRKKERS